MQRLSELPRPFFVSVITDTTVAAAKATIQHGIGGGADAFEINLAALAEESDELVGRLFDSSRLPTYTSCRRASFMRVYGLDQLPRWDDDERMKRQLRWAGAGSAAIDIELDAFADPRPSGVAEGPAAISSQRAVAAAAHAANVDVIYSCHASSALSPPEVAEISEIARDRGGTLAKIVATVSTVEEALQMLAGAVQVARRNTIPTTVVAGGSAGLFTRILAPILGAGWVLCQQELKPGGFVEQPLLEPARQAVAALAGLGQFKVAPDASRAPLS